MQQRTWKAIRLRREKNGVSRQNCSETVIAFCHGGPLHWPRLFGRRITVRGSDIGNVEPEDATGCSNQIVAGSIYQALKSGVRISGSFTTAVLTSAATDAYCMAARRLCLKHGLNGPAQKWGESTGWWTRSVAISLPKPGDDTIPHQGGSRCVSQQGWAQRHPEWAIFTLRPSKHEPTLVRCSFDSSRHRADRHSHLVPKGEWWWRRRNRQDSWYETVFDDAGRIVEIETRTSSQGRVLPWSGRWTNWLPRFTIPGLLLA